MTPHLTALGLKPLTVEKRASPISTTTNTGAVSLVTKMNASACYKSLGIIKRLRSLSPSNAFSPEKRLLLDEAPAKTNNDKDTPIRSPLASTHLLTVPSLQIQLFLLTLRTIMLSLMKM
nr:uncharacterized protein LOC122321823 [Drosophila bipectinata]